MSDADFEKKAEQIFQEFEERMKYAATAVIDGIHGDILPHVSSDTEFNSTVKAEAAIRAILNGRVKHDGNYARVDVDGVTMSIDLGAESPYSICAALIKTMPECPKDRRIKALEDENERLISRRDW